MLRFYNGAITLADIRDMTFVQFGYFAEQISTILEMESGEKKVSGKAAVDMAMNDPAIRKK